MNEVLQGLAYGSPFIGLAVLFWSEVITDWLREKRKEKK
jgi:hypothetical protein